VGDSRSTWKRIAWRGGYYQEPWHYTDPFGESIVERFVTVGAGIPFPQHAGWFDLSVELGTRGNIERNHARERVARIGIGITLKEKVTVGRVD
jgi:hypothetical protein